MKKIFYLLLGLIGLSFNSCAEDEWSNGDPAYDHVYYTGFEDWGKLKNDVAFNVKQGETVAIAVQFWCEFVRDYDVETYYYVAGDLVRGTDYEIVDANGNTLQPDANGAFRLNWPNAIKGVQNVYVKALSGNKGKFYVQTFNPNSTVALSNQDLESTVQHRESQYEVRVFTQNYRVTVNVK